MEYARDFLFLVLLYLYQSLFDLCEKSNNVRQSSGLLHYGLFY